MIDRVEPTQCPAGPPQGYQNWRRLLFLHWRVPVEAIRAVVPSELEVDTYEGDAYVGVVPFEMRDVRPKFCPRRLAFNFLETNVRTYVTYRGSPGVYFFSLDANSRIAVWVARARWGLPYFSATMSLHHDGTNFRYASRRTHNGARHDVTYRVHEMLGELPPTSRDFFFLERYLLFVQYRGRIMTGQVHHRPYPAQAAEVLSLSDELVAAAGIEVSSADPDFVHYAAGVDVSIFPLR